MLYSQLISDGSVFCLFCNGGRLIDLLATGNDVIYRFPFLWCSAKPSCAFLPPSEPISVRCWDTRKSIINNSNLLISVTCSCCSRSWVVMGSWQPFPMQSTWSLSSTPDWILVGRNNYTGEVTLTGVISSKTIIIRMRFTSHRSKHLVKFIHWKQWKRYFIIIIVLRAALWSCERERQTSKNINDNNLSS